MTFRIFIVLDQKIRSVSMSALSFAVNLFRYANEHHWSVFLFCCCLSQSIVKAAHTKFHGLLNVLDMYAVCIFNFTEFNVQIFGFCSV
jgi:hypothetical protein